MDIPRQEKTRFETQQAVTAERKKRHEEYLAKRHKRELEIRRSVDALLNTADGRTVFKYLFHQCGYNRSSIAIDPRTKEPQPGATNHNEAMRLVYINLRAKATPVVLSPVELEAELETQTQETPE